MIIHSNCCITLLSMIVVAYTNEASCALCFIHNDSSETNDTTVCTQVLCTDRLCCKNSATEFAGKGDGEGGQD